ncbi:ATP-binding protein [Bradyrhizobium sp. B117]|uniref:hybrid sensor histidine kinase/response regulator n=1 Tax=Bradyrhizobium sp. B117 TaxID=3140246 RepID=UPI0031837F59
MTGQPTNFAAALRLAAVYLLTLVSFAVGLAFTCAFAQAGEDGVDLARITDGASLIPSLSFLDDREGRLSAEEALSHSGWMPASPRAMTLGFTSSAFWLRGTLYNSGDQPVTRWLSVGNERLEDVRYFRFVPGADKPSETVLAGTRIPVRSRPITAVRSVFPVTLAPGEKIVFALRVQSRSTVNIQVSAWNPATFQESEAPAALFEFLLIGSVATMAIFTLALGFAQRDRIFLALGTGAIAEIIYDLAFQGLLYRYVLTDGGDVVVRTPGVSGLIAHVLLYMMAAMFIGIDRIATWWRILCLCSVLLLAGSVWAAFGDYRTAVSNLTTLELVFEVVWIVAVLDSWRRGFGNARLVLIAGGPGAIRLLLNLGEILGLWSLPWFVGSAITWNNLSLMLLLILIVIARGREVRRAREQAREELMAVKEHTRENLQRAVEERTRELQAALLAADEANRAKSDFLTVMSHEIRTPMNGMLGAIHLLKSMPLADKVRTAVDVAERTGAAMLATIGDILDFARISDRRLETEYAPFDLHALLADVQAIMSLRAEQKNLSLVVTTDPALPIAVMGDVDRLRQVLLNLVGNAVKFTASGEIRLSAAPDPNRADWIRLQVTDTGIGIPPDRIDRLFEPFTQADASIARRFGGTGLGLAICRRLTEAMGGDITAESEPGQGCTFLVRLPLPAAELADIEIPSAAGGDNAVQTSRSILIVDDDENNRFVLSGSLGVMGHRVLEATDGAQALALLAAQPVDLVLADLQMPGMDGTELVRRIRALPADRRTVPVVAVTADVTAGVVERCLQAGMDGYLSKPVMPDDLHRTIDAICAGGPFVRTGGQALGEDFLASLKQQLGTETVGRLVGQALATVKRGAAEIEESLQRGDRARARQAAHRLAGSAGLAGLTALSSAATTLEHRLAQSWADGLEADLNAMLVLAASSAEDLKRIYSGLAENR